MQSERFLNKVTAFIRSKEAQVHVYDELKRHIEHSKNAWLKKGIHPMKRNEKQLMKWAHHPHSENRWTRFTGPKSIGC